MAAATRAELAQRLRFRADEFGTNWLKGADANYYDINDLLLAGLRRYYEATECCRRTYGAPSVAGQDIYHHGAFGVVTVDTQQISTYAAAGSNNPTLIDDEPASDYASDFHVTVSIMNPTGNPLAVVANTYTVTGTAFGGLPLTEVISVPAAASLAAGAVTTVTSAQRFATVATVTKAGSAQTALLQHAMGVAADTPGSRVFRVLRVKADGIPLKQRSRAWLDGHNAEWETMDAGTPTVWFPESDQMVRVYVPSSASITLSIDGYEHPDPLTFAADAHTPAIAENDCDLMLDLAMVEVCERAPSEENLARLNIIGKRTAAGIAAARKRIHGNVGGSLIVGRRAGPQVYSRWNTDESTLA